MIRTANPAIDVARLEERVRAVADREAAAMHPVLAMDEAALALRIRYVREVLADTEVRLQTAAARSAPRDAVPPRLAKLGPLGPALVRAMNYAFKAQRENDAEMRFALGGTVAALSALADLIEHRR